MPFFGRHARWAGAALGVVGLLGGLGLTMTAVATAAATPTVTVVSASTPMALQMTFTTFNAVASCPAGTTLVGGGDELTLGGKPVPNSGSVTLGVHPSDTSGNPVANGSVDPSSWTTTGGYSAMDPGTDVVTSFAMCSSGITSATVTEVATSAPDSVGPVTAICPGNTSLVGGGGGYTSFAISKNVYNNTKLYDSFPSDPAGDVPANNSTNPTAWTVQGNTNNPAGAITTAFADCATDVAVATVVTSTTTTVVPASGGTATATTSCPGNSVLLDGGTHITNDPSGPGTGGQGVHVIGDYPSDASANPVSAGSAGDWTVIAEDGGQPLNALSSQAFALCAMSAPKQAAQSITFPAPAPGTVGGSAMLSATGGGSGNPVTFSVDPTSGPGVCSLSGVNGSTVSYAAAGSCVLDANQAGNASFTAAPQVSQTVAVTTTPTLIPQSIAFPAPAPGVVGGSAMLSATGGGSGNPVTFSVDPTSGPGVCSLSGVNGAAVSYTAAGSCVLDADQAGNTAYAAAPEVSQTVSVTTTPAPQPPGSSPGGPGSSGGSGGSGGPGTSTGGGPGGNGAGSHGTPSNGTTPGGTTSTAPHAISPPSSAGPSTPVDTISGVLILSGLDVTASPPPGGKPAGTSRTVLVVPGHGLGEGLWIALAALGSLIAGMLLEWRGPPRLFRRRPDAPGPVPAAGPQPAATGPQPAGSKTPSSGRNSPTSSKEPLPDGH